MRAAAQRMGAGAPLDRRRQAPPPERALRSVPSEFNGLSTYVHDYLVDSLPAEMLWLVVRNGGSIGFSSLAAGGRMLQAVESPGGPPALSSRTPANWGPNEAWERQRSEGGAATAPTQLVSARWKAKSLGFLPLLVSALPTQELARAEAYWGGLLFAAREQLREVTAAAAEGEARTAEQLKATQRQLALAGTRLEELEARLALGRESSGRDSTCADLPACASAEGCSAAADGDAAALRQEVLTLQLEHEAQIQALQAAHAAEAKELRRRLAAAECALADMSTARDAALAAARADLAAKDVECCRLVQDRHRLDAALHVIKGMALAAKQCSPSSSSDGGLPPGLADAAAALEGVAEVGGLPLDAGTAVAVLEAATAAVADEQGDQQPAVEYLVQLPVPTAGSEGAGEGQPLAGPHQHSQEAALPQQASATLRWLEQQDEVPLPPTMLDPCVRRLMDEEMMISFRPEAQAAAGAQGTGGEELMEDERPTVDVGPGCRLVTYADGHPGACLDEAALNRILDAPLPPPGSRRRRARVYKSLASAPASPATEASGDGAWNAGALSLPSTAIKGERPPLAREPLADLLQASAAVAQMGASSSPKAADALAELMADQLVLRASLQAPPAGARGRGAPLRRSAPAAPAAACAKPRSSFLQRSVAIDVFSLHV